MHSNSLLNCIHLYSPFDLQPLVSQVSPVSIRSRCPRAAARATARRHWFRPASSCRPCRRRAAPTSSAPKTHSTCWLAHTYVHMNTGRIERQRIHIYVREYSRFGNCWSYAKRTTRLVLECMLNSFKQYSLYTSNIYAIHIYSHITETFHHVHIGQSGHPKRNSTRISATYKTNKKYIYINMCVGSTNTRTTTRNTHSHTQFQTYRIQHIYIFVDLVLTHQPPPILYMYMSSEHRF